MRPAGAARPTPCRPRRVRSDRARVYTPKSRGSVEGLALNTTITFPSMVNLTILYKSLLHAYALVRNRDGSPSASFAMIHRLAWT